MDIPKKLSRLQRTILARLNACENYTIRIVDLCYDIANVTKTKVGLHDKNIDLGILAQKYINGEIDKERYELITKWIKGYKDIILRKSFTQSISRSVKRLAKRGLIERIYGEFDDMIIYVTPDFPIADDGRYLSVEDLVKHCLKTGKDSKFSPYTYEEIRKNKICPKCIRPLMRVEEPKGVYRCFGYKDSCGLYYKFVWGKKGTHVKLTPLGIEICKNLWR